MLRGDNWERVQEIFLEAADLRASERARFLDSACDRDTALRQEVESLLEADASGPTVLDSAIQSEAASLLEEPQLPSQVGSYREIEKVRNIPAESEQQAALVVGHMIGPYHIIRLLGKGGMGAVFEGERGHGQSRQRVAIKVLQMSARSDAERRRFLRERQILAELEHPNIARLFDDGTAADGSPYIVMERIDGLPLIDFANSRQLSIRERVQLFRHVANAVQYAHQKLVVHRDLKPGNILVAVDSAGRPVPKLLDFGIAKLLETETANVEKLTATGFHFMTPDYASPEQVQGKPVTAASDVYSLGAVLYELLSGTRPHGINNYNAAEIAEQVCVRDVPPPSATGGAQLRGDLDTIVLKAMQKAPERRYNSAEQFSEDLRRYLENMPVLARPDTYRYRLRKFVRRHWIGLGATAAVAAALSTGAAVSLYQARQARNQAYLAQERFELVRTLANRFLFDFHAEIENLSGTTKAQQMVVNTAVEYLDKLSRTAGSDQALLLELAEAYARLSRVQGAAGVSGAGRHEDALVSQQRSVEFYRRLAAIDPGKRRGLARSLLDEAHIEENLSEPAKQLQHAREAVQILDLLLAANPHDATLSAECGMAQLRMSQALLTSDLLGEALTAALKAQEYLHGAPEAGHDQSAKYGLAIAQQVEANVRLASGDVENATAVLERALRTIDEIAAAEPGNRRYQYLLIQHLYVLSQTYYSLEDISAGDPRKAAAVNERLRDLAGKFLDSDSADRSARMQIAIAESDSVPALMEIDPFRAVKLARSGLTRWDEALKTVSRDQFSIPRRARAVMRLARALLRAGAVPEAIARSLEASQAFQNLLSAESNAIFQRAAVFAFTTAGETLAAGKNDSEARKMFNDAASLGERLLADERCPLRSTVAAAYAFDQFGEYWKSCGDRAQARQWFERTRLAWSARTEQTTAVRQRLKLAEGKCKAAEP